MKKGILEIILKGEATESNYEELTNKLTAIIKAKGVKNVLMDARAINGRFGYYAEAYKLVRSYPPDRPKVNIAIVDLPANAVFGSYCETTALRARLSWKWFMDIDAARTWLKNKQIRKQ